MWFRREEVELKKHISIYIMIGGVIIIGIIIGCVVTML